MKRYTLAMTGRARPVVQARIEKAFEFKTKNKDTTPEEWADILKNADALYSLGNVKIDAALLDKAPNLKVVAQVSVGYDNIDIAACTARGIKVGNTPGAVTEATADIAYGLILCSARYLPAAWLHVKSGEWGRHRTFGMGVDLYGKTLGILGLGAIGMAVARRALASGMKIVYHNRRPAVSAGEVGAVYLSQEELLKEADFILVMLPLSAETKKMISRKEFALMKPTARLINAARGAIVDTDALYEALKEKRIAYAAMDVTDPEPLPADHPLLTLDNILVLPHIGTLTEETRDSMSMMTLDNIIAALEGHPMPACVNEAALKSGG